MSLPNCDRRRDSQAHLGLLLLIVTLSLGCCGSSAHTRARSHLVHHRRALQSNGSSSTMHSPPSGLNGTVDSPFQNKNNTNTNSTEPPSNGTLSSPSPAYNNSFPSPFPPPRPLPRQLSPPVPRQMSPPVPQLAPPVPQLSPKLSPSPPKVQSLLTPIQQVMLEEHNRLRALHGARPMVWDTLIAATAEQWAGTCRFQISSFMYGENLATISSSAEVSNVINGIGRWYAQGANYNYSTPGYSPSTGAFTQLIWNESVRLGCAVGRCTEVTVPPNGPVFPRATVLSCMYGPPGNGGSAAVWAAMVKPEL